MSESEHEEHYDEPDNEVIAEVEEPTPENDPLHELQEQEMRTVNDALKMQAVLLEEQREHHRVTAEQVEQLGATLKQAQQHQESLSRLLAEEQSRKETNAPPIETEPTKRFGKLGY